jgi:hypothetical protein
MVPEDHLNHALLYAVAADVTQQNRKNTIVTVTGRYETTSLLALLYELAEALYYEKAEAETEDAYLLRLVVESRKQDVSRVYVLGVSGLWCLDGSVQRRIYTYGGR